MIPHALRFTYSNRDFTSDVRSPAIRSDQPNGTTTGDPATAMDMRLRLHMSGEVDRDARTVPGGGEGETRFVRMICHALQDYGMIASDGTGERYDSYSHVIRDQSSPSDGLARDATSGIPWSELRVLASSGPWE